MAITIQVPSTIAEFNLIEELQAEIWGTALGVTPGIFLYIIAKEGGVVLLAVDGQRPVGFSYGFIGLTTGNRVKLASHQTGVLAAYRDAGVGRLLKLAQRQAALDRQLDHITWTFDPLQGRNARLNLRKLGAVCNTYIPNLYGDMPDELNQGLPSDRFVVDWWIASGHVERRLAGQIDEPDFSTIGPVLNPARSSGSAILTPADDFGPPRGPRCLVEIPADIGLVKEKSPRLAQHWRRQTRQIFETAFAAGYVAVDLLLHRGRDYYLLQKNWHPDHTL